MPVVIFLKVLWASFVQMGSYGCSGIDTLYYIPVNPAKIPAPSGHTTSKQRWFNVDSTSWRWINVESTFFQRCVPNGLFLLAYFFFVRN